MATMVSRTRLNARLVLDCKLSQAKHETDTHIYENGILHSRKDNPSFLIIPFNRRTAD
jgi:hypothetical protein